MISSLRSRLLVSHLLVGAAVLLLVTASFLVILAAHPAADRIVYGRLETTSRVLTARVRLRGTDRLLESIDRGLNLVGQPVDAQVALYDAEGQLRWARADEESAPPSEAVVGALAREDGRGEYRLDGGRRWLLIVTPLPRQTALAVFAPAPTLRVVTSLVREALGPLWQAALFAFLISMVLAILLARWISRPLTRLSDAADELGEGEGALRVQPEGPTEVRDLARAFNDMVRRVRSGQQAQRDFVANVSHELRTPLTSIQGFAQAIQEGAVVGEEGQRKAAAVIYEEAERLRRLVEDLLALARFDAGQVELERAELDLAHLLHDTIDRFQVLAERGGIHLEGRVGELPTFVGDGDRLAQVLVNLLDNAIGHTPEGGSVSVTARSAGGEIIVEVADTGPGIEPEKLPRLFERFYQTDRARGGGAGLGLAIAQEIVRAHGGRIWAESEVGQGSRFLVVLPVARPTDSTVSARRR